MFKIKKLSFCLLAAGISCFASTFEACANPLRENTEGKIVKITMNRELWSEISEKWVENNKDFGGIQILPNQRSK